MLDADRLARARRTRINAERRRRGERIWPETFADRLTSPLPGPREQWQLFRHGRPPVDRTDVVRIPVDRSGLLRATGQEQTVVTWVGHATFVLQIGGLTVLTDPIWSDAMPGVTRRLTPPGIAWAELPPIDAVVISHNHYDHLDAPTIRRLPRDTPVFVPAALGEWFERRGFTQVTEFDWWESTTLAGVSFDFVPAHHWSRRSLTDTCKTLWGGWVMTDDSGRRVYFAGDTGYGHWFGEIGRRYPGIDVALLPIGAYHPRWFMQPVHLDPEEAVRACGDLGASRMATMHWGTFVLTSEPLTEPRERAQRAWAAAGRPRDDLWDLAVGESRPLPH
ncbi:MBL fold metallo-hydrolase [Cryptosporangium aurantiacum]|uniref:L-ascorbate metabolism protein UlaG, beta-lactamase superfamily n=1 Tax=Cryptosporangium aurantiacum TaxID=134849 RepID=A0A1M7RJV0_9ACTN|nr:MBL fold metallo-hydrolase [Cryptosporangium aurantiacum]SHN46420.1 L-ascorbate metabolism protein UlaG, beta-lactamase superfamily [Cryptosporangium aurantiacum]